MRRLARLLHCSEGHAYTVVLSLILAAVLCAYTIPAVANHRAPAPVKAIPFQDLSSGDSAAPLTVTDSAFASDGAGPAPVPPRELPVAAAGGAVTAAAFIRLSGQARVLHLGVDAGASRGAELARPVVCPIQTEMWEPRRDLALSAAPAYDCSSAVPGVRSPDGSWSFDLGGFTDRAGSRGFAIVPAAPSSGAAPGPDFSLLFVPAATSR